MQAPTSYFAVQMNDFVASIDFDMWWDNVFTDFVLHRRIDQAQDRVERLQEGLVKVADVLGERRSMLLNRVDSLISSTSDASESERQQ